MLPQRKRLIDIKRLKARIMEIKAELCESTLTADCLRAKARLLRLATSRIEGRRSSKT